LSTSAVKIKTACSSEAVVKLTRLRGVAILKTIIENLKIGLCEHVKEPLGFLHGGFLVS
jgi:hypothetical protein